MKGKEKICYCIEVYYNTGNSFGSMEDRDIIPLSWENIDIAKENLNRIKEHNEFVNELNDSTYKIDNTRSRSEIIDSRSNKDWLVLTNDEYESENYIMLMKDSGEFTRVYCFWVGYFESIISAKIIINNEDTEINF